MSSRDQFWRPEDLAGSTEAVAKTLSRLTAGGDIRRGRRGLYWRGTMTQLGMVPPPTDFLVQGIVDEQGIGPTEWSAGLVSGLS